MASSPSEERRPEERSPQPSPPSPPTPPETAKECVYKTKLVEFWGRTTPIVLQNDNGPCPLLAICNVLLLKNDLNLSPDTTEVSQDQLLSLVAERLIDSNSNTKDKGEGYAENQQQNIADAIDLLPRLATGIDVNIKFRRIRDFEFTPECAIFDLLDIPLYHGWIVDPQDYETASAIGSKSYNTLMEELVALETRNEGKYKNAPEEDCVDFVAATTATLGVPSPCLSNARSFDDALQFDARKGDLEEEAELLRALKISESESPSSKSDPLIPDESTVKVDSVVTLAKHTVECSDFLKPDQSIPADSNASPEPEVNLFQMVSEGNDREPSKYVELDGQAPVFDVGQVGNSISHSPEIKVVHEDEHLSGISGSMEKLDNPIDSTTDVNVKVEKKGPEQSADLKSDSSRGRIPSEALASSESEPIYEGEECIMEPGTLNNEVREAIYEGEVVLASQADNSNLDLSSEDEHSLQAGELIKNFLKSNASQLTIYGLFCLQEGLKDRELCVFFRNNHFSTMYKTNGELYLLVTDLGYISQTDLVWEKLNEVNGDSLFVTGNFKEFKVENRSNDSWNEHNAMSSTAEYIAKMDSEVQAGRNINSDLQLAIALQQQEMDEQHQRQNPPQPQQQHSITASRLITGPLVPRSSTRASSSYRPEPKSKDKDKDKCTVM